MARRRPAAARPRRGRSAGSRPGQQRRLEQQRHGRPVKESQQQPGEHRAEEESDQRRQPFGREIEVAFAQRKARQYGVSGHVCSEHAAHRDVAHGIGETGDDGEQTGLELWLVWRSWPWHPRYTSGIVALRSDAIGYPDPTPPDAGKPACPAAADRRGAALADPAAAVRRAGPAGQRHPRHHGPPDRPPARARGSASRW